MPPKKSGGAAAAAAAAASGPSARSGLVFKGRWKLGQMLGEGACGQVFEATDVTGTQGEHAWVIKVTPLPAGGVAAGGKKKKLSKADEALKRNADTLYMEQLVYKNYLVNVPGVPALPLTLAYGEDQNFRFLVLQRLGQDLNQAFEASGKRFAPAKIADYGRQMLAALKRLHERQLVFIDVKPENFMLGLPGARGGAEAASVFMVDFGLVEKYTASAGGHKPMEGQGAAGGTAGTPLFSSLAVHEGKPPARRDDLEGLGLVLLFFARGGHLPWADATSDVDCLARKKGAALADLCRGVGGGEPLQRFLELARALPFEAAPDYDAFDKLLAQLAKAKGAGAAPAAAASSASGGGGGAGRKRGGGGGGEENGGGGGNGKKSRTTGASSAAGANAAANGAGAGGGAPSGKQRGGASSSSKPAGESTSTSPGGGWLAKTAGAVGKQLLRGLVDLTTSPPPATGKADGAGKARKSKAPSAAAGAKRGRSAAGALAALAVAAAEMEEVVEVSESGSEAEEQDEEKENASVCSRASAASAAATLALEAIAGPHKGQRFALGQLSKAVVLGSAGAVALPKDAAVEGKHARLESTGREAVHNLKVVPVGGSQVLVNRVVVGKAGRMVFVGDLIEIGDSTLALRRG